MPRALSRPFSDAVAAQYVLQRLSNVPESVRPSVRPSHHSTAAAACGGFAAERRASIDSGGRPAANAGSVMLTAAVDEAVNTDLLQLNHSVYRADVYRTIK